jgi:hypothetical protein
MKLNEEEQKAKSTQLFEFIASLIALAFLQLHFLLLYIIMYSYYALYFFVFT